MEIHPTDKNMAPAEQPYVSDEEAERRTNREAFLLLGGGFLFLCTPSLMCYPEYRMFAISVLLISVSFLSGLWTLLIILRTLDLLTRLGLRKRKKSFLSADELEQANRG
jgi:hypothetical protein